MAKPIKERDTQHPFGRKLNEVMREKGIAGDYSTAATVFGVKTPSVYDWVDHGRIAKRHYKTLAEWSGRPLEWWFEELRSEQQATEDSPVKLHSSEEAPVCLRAKQEDRSDSLWPFRHLPVTALRDLDPDDLRRVEDFAMALLATKKTPKVQNGW